MHLRYSFRLLRKSPLFTISAVAALALGIGANTAVFSVVNSVLLQPLRYKDPDRLVVALHEGTSPVSPADFFDYRKSATTFEALGAAQAWSGNITGLDKPENVSGVQVTSDVFATLGVHPQIGRVFQIGEDQPEAGRVVILSDRLWRRDFGARREVLGEKVSIDGIPHTIVGVMPAAFQFPPFWFTRAEMWAPLDLSKRATDRGGRSLRLFARLKSGASVEAAQTEMSTIAQRLAQQYPDSNKGLGITVQRLGDKVTGSVRPLLLVLLGTVALVLLIASANVANLLLARASARRREIAVRIAIGAARRDIIAYLLTESIVLSVLGGLCGLLFSVWAIGALSASLPASSLPRQAEIATDAVVLCFTLAVSLLTGLISGLVPALQFSRGDVNEDLKAGVRGTTAASGTGRTRQLLVAAEVAVCLMLMAGAGLMIRTFANLMHVETGFNPHSLLTFEVSVAGTPHDAPSRRSLLFQEVARQLSSIGGVRSVSAINHLPLAGDTWRLGFEVEGRPAPPPGTEQSAVYRVVMPRYFETMQLGILRGRDFNEHDNTQAPAAVIINQTMARRYWPAEDPLGRAITMDNSSAHPLRLSVIGVVADARQDDWTKPADPEVYLAYLQRPDSMGLKYMTFVARTDGNPESSVANVQGAVWAVDRNLPVSRIQSMDAVIANQLWRARTATVLLGCFGGIALVLAALGIYGVISYNVARRTAEIGVRIALGAGARQILGLALADGMRPVFAGTALGLAGAFVLTRWMASLLYGVTAADAVTFSAVTAVLMGVALLANLIPAFRASRLNPLVALRQE